MGFDFCPVPTLAFKIRYVFVILDHSRRQVLHFNVTRFPCMDWVILQLKEAMPFGKQPRFMFRDNDGIYGNGVGSFLKMCGMEELRTAYHSPWQNPFVERYFGTLRRELLTHIVPINENHCYRLIGFHSDSVISEPKWLQIDFFGKTGPCMLGVQDLQHLKL